MKTVLLIGDIGGTKTTLTVIDPQSGPRLFIDKTTFPSAGYSSLDALVTDFLRGKEDWHISHATFGVAGPVSAGRAQITNLPWIIEETSLSRTLNAPASLINDLGAIANAVQHLEPQDVATLNPGTPVAQGALAVIAPGTGLGEAFLVWDGGAYQSHPSEGGHTDFGPVDELQSQLLVYLRRRYDRVSYERVCSGLALPNLYAFLKDSRAYPEPAWLRDSLATAPDPNPIISRAALENSAEIAVATFDLFVSILGSEAGNLALKVLATGGVYIGGGIPLRILPYLKKESFLRAFQRKGRFSAMLAAMPVRVILNPASALLGAAYHALQHMT